MATMIPNDIEEFGTDGERVFFNFLRSVAKRDSRYVAWYLPNIKDREPDFLLYCEDVGLVIFEVNPSALRSEARSLLRVNPERTFDFALRSRAWRVEGSRTGL